MKSKNLDIAERIEYEIQQSDGYDMDHYCVSVPVTAKVQTETKSKFDKYLFFKSLQTALNIFLVG